MCSTRLWAERMRVEAWFVNTIQWTCIKGSGNAVRGRIHIPTCHLPHSNMPAHFLLPAKSSSWGLYDPTAHVRRAEDLICWYKNDACRGWLCMHCGVKWWLIRMRSPGCPFTMIAERFLLANKCFKGFCVLVKAVVVIKVLVDQALWQMGFGVIVCGRLVSWKMIRDWYTSWHLHQRRLRCV